MLYSKNDLAHNDYDWASGAVYSGSPTRRTFDPFNGEQVLFIINSFCKSLAGVSVAEAQKIEALIRNKLPINAKSEISVVRWLEGVYG